MKTTIRKIIMGLIAASAILPTWADGLAITPTTISNAMQQVYFSQTFTATGGSGNYSGWAVKPWSCTVEESTYAVGANETPLWEGEASFNTNYVFCAYDLPFEFPYCGQICTNVNISTRGAILLANSMFRDVYYYDPTQYYLGWGYDMLVPLWTYTYNVKGYVDTSVADEISFRFEADYDTYNDSDTDG